MKSTIGHGISLVLLASLGVAHAQENAAPEAKSTEVAKPNDKKSGKEKNEVIAVTGTRIKRLDMNAAAPLTIIGKSEIEASGKQTVTDLVKSLPAAVGNSVTTSTTNGGGGGSGNIALRGLDSSSTLVLLNGRRLPLDASGSSPDLNSIPVAAIERIEVLQDGASAIYGSDAIAGVINIITRKNFDGLDFNAYVGQASRGDLQTKSYDLTYGASNDKGSMLLGMNYYTQGKVASRDRDVSKATFKPSSATPDAHIGKVIVDANAPQDKQSQSDYRTFTADDKYNYSSITDAIMAQDRKSFYISGEYELTKGLKGFVETHFTNTLSDYNSAPTPLFLSQETGNLKVSANNPYNSFGTDLTDVKKRFLQFGPRGTETDSDTIRNVIGLQGDLGIWNWDVAYNHGDAKIRSTTSNLINKTNLQLGIGDPTICKAMEKLGCVPVNILGPNGSFSDAMINFLRISSTDFTQTNVDSYTLNFAGDLLETSFGKIGVAVGVEARGEKYNSKSDPNSEQFNTIGATNTKSTAGDRDVKEAYVELTVPVTELIEFDFAARHSDYSDFGTTTNPKFGMKIRPIEGLTIRGSYSTGFRAPSLVELYQGQAENFAFLHDPCQDAGACTVQADEDTIQWLALQGGNPELEPEKSKSFTYGMSYGLAGFNAKVDYFNIVTNNAIDTNPQFVIDQFRKNALFADKVTLDDKNNITRLEATALNLAARKVEGVDLAFDYAMRKTSTGAYTFNLMGSTYLKYMNQADKTAPFENVVGKFVDASSGGRGSIPKWKGLLDSAWTNAGYDAGITANYLSALDAGAENEYPTLKAWTTYDLRAGYDFLSYGKVTVGINNVADAKPPVTDAAGNDNIDSRTHNLIGRFYYARWGVQL